jgi:uncharacterized repeat protein (TIGR03803 family)
MRRPRRSLQSILATFAALVLSAIGASAATETILYDFHPTIHGQYPSGGLISDSAGNLYGTTIYGGAYDYGTVYMLSPNAHGGWTETVLYSFKGTSGGASDGWDPTGALTFDSAGNLYGATTWGGKSSLGVGTVFKLSKLNGKWEETILWSFQQHNSKDGFNPQGGLVFDQAGNLYGTTEYGGGYTQNGCSFDGGCGMAFRLSPQAGGLWKEKILYVFQGGVDGEYPNEGLAIDASDRLYGTTRSNYNSNGSVFQLTPSSSGPWTETTIYSFTGGSDGDAPGGDLIFDQAGNLDGTTSGGGTSTGCYEGSPCGTVFQLTPSNGKWSEKVLYSFNGTDGQAPEGKLFLDQSGDLYGTTYYGGAAGLGTAFKLTPGSGGSWNESVLWSFTGGADGETPQYGVVAGAAGRLYGVNTPYSGPGNGIVFELTSNAEGAWSETTLTNFPDADGALPQASVVSDAEGNLYGVTSQGGTHGYGTVFELTHSASGWKESILYNFTSGTGAGPYLYSNPSTLILDAAGNLYGETAYGGAAGFGTVFELYPSSGGKWTEKDLFTFTGPNTGTRPIGGLVFDAAGNLYGTTEMGGSHMTACASGCGTVFKLTPAQGHPWTETVLYSFAGGSDGAQPAASLIFDQAGNLYGTTSTGGYYAENCGDGCGTVFKLSFNSGSGWTESKLYEFSDAHGDGALPAGGVIFDQAGNLYGATSFGGNHGEICGTDGCGIVYELSPQSSGWKETILYTFLGSDATFPDAGLIFDQAGNLYGTTEGGLYGDWGSVFELSPISGGGWSESALYTFPYPGGGDGYFAEASLILGPSGTLYGTTAGGGNGNEGTVFQIAP